jgi:GNAT superfamily N-acetyltransferase
VATDPRAQAGHHVFLAEDENGHVVGFASGGPNRDTALPYDAELFAIYVLQYSQRQGLGRRLLRAFAEAVAADRRRSLIVWVLEENMSARRFYESMKGAEVSRKDITIGGAKLVEVGYGWPDLAVLLTERVYP